MTDFKLTAAEKRSFFDEGYFIFNIHDNELIDRVNADVEQLQERPELKTNSRIYSYNDSPRIVESWRLSENCKALAKHNVVSEVLSFLFDSHPRPFSTINFLRSTQQPLHSDYVHFGTFPELRLAGTWVALEDINPRSGPLVIVPKSHLLPIFDYQIDLGLPIPKSMDILKTNYELYETWISEQLKAKNLEPYTPSLKKGDCVVWAANLVHGSPNCLDSKSSRKSQVTHWDFSDVEFQYNPNFTDRTKGRFVKRELLYF